MLTPRTVLLVLLPLLAASTLAACSDDGGESGGESGGDSGSDVGAASTTAPELTVEEVTDFLESVDVAFDAIGTGPDGDERVRRDAAGNVSIEEPGGSTVLMADGRQAFSDSQGTWFDGGPAPGRASTLYLLALTDGDIDADGAVTGDEGGPITARGSSPSGATFELVINEAGDGWSIDTSAELPISSGTRSRDVTWTLVFADRPVDWPL